MEWKLQVTKKKSGPPSYRVTDGKTSFNVATAAKRFRDEDAADGIVVEVERGKDGQPSKVTIPGKPELQPQSPAGGAAAGDRRERRPQGGPTRPGAGGPRGARQGHGPERRGHSDPRRDASAPYSFVDASQPLPYPEETGAPRVSGLLRCRGTALTPLLVAAPQSTLAGEEKERVFFTVGGRPVIPGSSLKGLLRTGVEALCCASMAGLVGDAAIAFRDVGTLDSEYSQRFKSASEGGRLRAGMLVERGADRAIVPCAFARVRLPDLGLGTCERMTAAQITEHALRKDRDLAVTFVLEGESCLDGVPIAARAAWGSADDAGSTRGRFVPTGWMPRKSKGYIFYDGQDEGRIELSDEVWKDFRDQLTRSQEDLLALLRKSKRDVPVFFLVERGEVVAIGLSRYFRIRTRHTPARLAGGIDDSLPEADLPRRIFGSVRPARRGRVRVTAGYFRGTPSVCRFPAEGPLVAGNPAPSAVAMYLVQDSIDTKYRSDLNTPRNERLVTYDSDSPRLRGRKFYWHRSKPEAPLPPNDNLKMQAVYRPLAAGACFDFTVSFERLTPLELGAVIESLEFPQGHAHKLGLGKPFGLGSVRIDVEWSVSRVEGVRERYRSLRGRLHGSPHGGGGIESIVHAARTAFRSAVERAVGQGEGAFERIGHIAEYRCITNWESPPAPGFIRYMPLSKAAEPTYATKSILPSAIEVRERQGDR